MTHVIDNRGVRMTVDGVTGVVEQSLEYLPSGYVCHSENYGRQPFRFCGKELLTMHGWDMYDSFARYQYARLPRFSTMDPLAEWDYATSPYAYCQNDFVNLVDPWGLDGWPGRMNYIEEAVVWGYRRGTIAGDIYGAEIGASIGMWFDGVGAVPGAIIGGIIGGIVGGLAGETVGGMASDVLFN